MPDRSTFRPAQGRPAPIEGRAASRTDWTAPLKSRLAPLSLPPAREREIVDEMAQHLDDRYRELLSNGAVHDEAIRLALDEINDEDLLAREMRTVSHSLAQEPLTEGAPARGWLADTSEPRSPEEPGEWVALSDGASQARRDGCSGGRRTQRPGDHVCSLSGLERARPTAHARAHRHRQSRAAIPSPFGCHAARLRRRCGPPDRLRECCQPVVVEGGRAPARGRDPSRARRQPLANRPTAADRKHAVGDVGRGSGAPPRVARDRSLRSGAAPAGRAAHCAGFRRGWSCAAVFVRVVGGDGCGLRRRSGAPGVASGSRAPSSRTRASPTDGRDASI